MKPYIELNSSKTEFLIKKNFYQLDIKYLQKELFDDKGYLIINNFISKDDAIFIRDLVFKNRNCFKKGSGGGNHRLFMYPNGPYSYPGIFNQLYDYISILKNIIYSSHKFYIDYCSSIGVELHDVYSVLKYQKLHTWSCFYWYKNKESHFKHIDHYGELAAFLILSKLREDYMGGGLFIDKNNQPIYLDKFYEYGDLVFFDQASYYHEVKSISTERNQNGRLQFYVPTIPYGYMKTYLRFEDYPFKQFCSEKLNSYQKVSKFLGALSDNDIHYSRQNYFKHFKL
jgi:hypothetical protein